MGKWRYIVTKEAIPIPAMDGGSRGFEITWGVREYYEPDDSHGDGWTAETMKPFGETYGELLADVKAMARAVAEAGNGLILDLTGKEPKLRKLTTEEWTEGP